MTADTCAVLTAVFPLVLLAFLTERRNLRMKVRKMKFFRETVSYAGGVTILGLVLTVAGVQANGLTGYWALGAWMCAAATAVALFILVGFHIASAEVDEDEVA